MEDAPTRLHRNLEQGTGVSLRETSSLVLCLSSLKRQLTNQLADNRRFEFVLRIYRVSGNLAGLCDAKHTNGAQS